MQGKRYTNRRADQHGDWDLCPEFYHTNPKTDKLKIVKYNIYKRKYKNWTKLAYNVVHDVALIRERGCEV